MNYHDYFVKNLTLLYIEDLYLSPVENKLFLNMIFESASDAL